MHDGNTRGFLLAETDLSRMLEASSDSRDEYHYLIGTIMNIGDFLNRKLWENDMMSDRVILIDNIDEIHTTEMGADRIRRNLKLENVDVVEYCKDKIMDENCHIYRQGKNWYCEIDSVKITVNYYSYTIITADIIK